MVNNRLSMRKITEVLRLHFEHGRSKREIARIIGVSPSTDLIGDALAIGRTNDRPEAAALLEGMLTLRAYPMVAWCERINSGAARIGGRFPR